MSIEVDLRADIKQATLFLTAVERGSTRKALPRALNKTATTVRADAARRLQERRSLKIGVIKGAMRIERATITKHRAAVVVSGKPIPIRHFSRAGDRGVTVRITRGAKRHRLMRHGNKAFSNSKFAGGNIFVRTGRSRLPISKWAPVPGLPRVLVQKEIVAALRRVIAQTFPRRLEEELRFEISKARIKYARST